MLAMFSKEKVCYSEVYKQLSLVCVSVSPQVSFIPLFRYFQNCINPIEGQKPGFFCTILHF